MDIIKRILVVNFILILSVVVYGQHQKLKFAEKLVLGTSISYLQDYNRDFYRYHEWTGSLNIGVNIDHHFMIGLQNLFILGYGTRVATDNFNLFGTFIQYDFFDKSKNRLYIESGFYKGNYCTCGNSDPYKVNGLNYLNFGGGFELSIRKNINLEFGLSIYKILNSENKDDYGYGYYIAGINYIIFK